MDKAKTPLATGQKKDRRLVGGDVGRGILDRHESLDLEPEDPGLPIGSDAECSHVHMVAHALLIVSVRAVK